MRRRRKRSARLARPAARRRFRVKAPRFPKWRISSRQQRELAGIACLALAALLTLAVYLPAGGSAMVVIRELARPSAKIEVNAIAILNH